MSGFGRDMSAASGSWLLAFGIEMGLMASRFGIKGYLLFRYGVGPPPPRSVGIIMVA